MKIIRPKPRAILIAILVISAFAYCFKLTQGIYDWFGGLNRPDDSPSNTKMGQNDIKIIGEKYETLEKFKMGMMNIGQGKQLPLPPPVKFDQNSNTPLINRTSYPILYNSQFVPSRRIVHLDLKGAPPRVQYFEQFFRLIHGLGATGVLIEWEDMFPYSGILQSCKNGNAYTTEDVKRILRWAKENELEVIPLVQTFGHLEWVLKHEKFAHLRELEKYPQTICISNPEAISLVKTIIDQVMSIHHVHDNGTFFHIGCDEAWQVGLCGRCQNVTRDRYNGSRDRLMIHHMKNIAQYVTQKYKRRVLAWHDMLNDVMPSVLNESEIGKLVEPVVWAYVHNVPEYISPFLWAKLSRVFPYIWGASAFKGADRPDTYHPKPLHYIQMHSSWTQAITQQYRNFHEFRGLILTGWQRFDHFAVLCELLPIGIPSLAISLQVIQYGGQVNDDTVYKSNKILGCSSSYINMDYFGNGCQFPGNQVHDTIQQLKNIHTNAMGILDGNEVRGWISPFNQKHNYSSPWSADNVIRQIQNVLVQYDIAAHSVKMALNEVFYENTVDEFLMEYVDVDIQKLRDLVNEAGRLSKIGRFPVRPIRINRLTNIGDNVNSAALVGPGP